MPSYIFPSTNNTNNTTNVTKPSESPQKALQDAITAIQASLPTQDAFVAYSTEKRPSGALDICVIITIDDITEQRNYLFFESTEEYQIAAQSIAEDKRMDEAQVVWQSTKSTYPVVHPETVGCVLFGGYIIWR